MSFHKPTKADLRYANEVMARVAAVKTHDFDQHDYCSKCGQSMEHVCDTLIECFGQPGIIAISHLRRPPVEDEEVRVERGSGNVFKDLGVQPPTFTRQERARLGLTDDDVNRMQSMRWDDDGPSSA